jgi:hypothetical protein
MPTRYGSRSTTSSSSRSPVLPEGVPAVGFLLLHNPDEGKVLAISLFETEEDLQQGDATLNSMDPLLGAARDVC